MTTGWYIAVSTESLTSLHFALTSILFLRRARICYFCSVDNLSGSPKHITLGLLQHPPAGGGEYKPLILLSLTSVLSLKGEEDFYLPLFMDEHYLPTPV
jgi:hypothetical protein